MSINELLALVKVVSEVGIPVVVTLGVLYLSWYSTPSVTTTWKDLFGKVADATKVTGTVNWQSNCLVLDGSTYWSVPAPNLSRGTLEIVFSIDPAFIPVNTNYWYQASCVIGQELSGTQQDFGVLVDKNGKIAIGYGNSTIYSTTINAKDGLPHTVSYSYFRGPMSLFVDGILISEFATVVGGSEVSTLGIGWNKASSATIVKGKVFSIKWYSEALNASQIATNHSSNKAYYGF